MNPFLMYCKAGSSSSTSFFRRSGMVAETRTHVFPSGRALSGRNNRFTSSPNPASKKRVRLVQHHRVHAPQE